VPGSIVRVEWLKSFYVQVQLGREVLDNHVFYGVRTSQCVWGGEGGLLCRAVALSPIIGEVLDDWQEGMEAGKS
jgi:hypothetical protein